MIHHNIQPLTTSLMLPFVTIFNYYSSDLYDQGNPQALPIIPIGYFFFNEIPKLGQKFLLSFPFLGVLRIDYSYGFPDQGVTFIVDLLSSFTHR